MTSRRAVDVVGRLAGKKTKIGHAGTLDPLAEGVLVLCLGAATRLIEYVQRMPKRYVGTFLLGRQSASDDTDGEVVALVDPPLPTLAEITAAAAALCGDIRQRPPAFSAVKVKGRRAYHLARAGKPPLLEPRTVHFYGIKVVSYQYPELTLKVECGSGAYIRSLGRDLAESLGTAAVMSSLTRTAVGCFMLEDAVAPENLCKDSWTDHVLPPAAAVQMLPRLGLTADDLAEIRHGRDIPFGEENRGLRHASTEFAGIGPDGRLVAILVPRGNALLRPLKNLIN